MFTILSLKNFLIPSPPNLVKEYCQESNEPMTSLNNTSLCGGNKI